MITILSKLLDLVSRFQISKNKKEVINPNNLYIYYLANNWILLSYWITLIGPTTWKVIILVILQKSFLIWRDSIRKVLEVLEDQKEICECILVTTKLRLRFRQILHIWDIRFKVPLWERSRITNNLNPIPASMAATAITMMNTWFISKKSAA